MKVLINERLSQHKYKTPEGYLICQDAILARTGKQTYRRGEVFGQDTKDAESDIEVDRKYEEVFSPKTLASFENKPVTVEHPDEDVNVDNYKDYAVGFVRDVKQGKVDGEDVILGTLVITDAQTIKEIEDGEHTELSCGYDCDILDEENPQQRNIRGNHVALCEHGRAGIAKIVDSIEEKLSTKDSLTIRELSDLIKTVENYMDKASRDSDGRMYKRLSEIRKELISLGHLTRDSIKDGRNDDYFGQEEYEKYGEKVHRALRGKTISKKRDLAEESGGIVYEARKLGMTWQDLLKCLEGMCYNGKAEELYPGDSYKVKDSIKDSYTPSEIINILRRQSVGMNENLEIGEERNGWFAQIQNVGKATYENVAKYPNVSPKLSSWAWGRIWKDGKIKFNEKDTLNNLKQKMIRFLSIQTNDSIKDEDKYIVWADGTKQGNRALYRTATGNAQYCYSADAHQFSKDEAIKLTNQKGGKYTWLMKRVGDSVKDETKAEMIKKAQTWVDYDMKRYGKISQNTKDDIKALGLKIIDLGGEFEVQDSLKKYEVSYTKDGNEYIHIVRANSLEDAISKIKDDIPDRDIVLKMGEALHKTNWNTRKVLNKQTNKPARLDYFDENNLVGYEDETNNKVLLIKFKGKFMKKDEFINAINTKIK